MHVKCVHALCTIVNDPECIMGCTEVIYILCTKYTSVYNKNFYYIVDLSVVEVNNGCLHQRSKHGITKHMTVQECIKSEILVSQVHSIKLLQ